MLTNGIVDSAAAGIFMLNVTIRNGITHCALVCAAEGPISKSFFSNIPNEK